LTALEAPSASSSPRAGDQRAIARLLSKVERSLAEIGRVMELVADLTAKARRRRLHRAAGAGKSTLVANTCRTGARTESGRGARDDSDGAHLREGRCWATGPHEALAANRACLLRSVRTSDPLSSSTRRPRRVGLLARSTSTPSSARRSAPVQAKSHPASSPNTPVPPSCRARRRGPAMKRA